MELKRADAAANKRCGLVLRFPSTKAVNVFLRANEGTKMKNSVWKRGAAVRPSGDGWSCTRQESRVESEPRGGADRAAGSTPPLRVLSLDITRGQAEGAKKPLGNEDGTRKKTTRENCGGRKVARSVHAHSESDGWSAMFLSLVLFLFVGPRIGLFLAR